MTSTMTLLLLLMTLLLLMGVVMVVGTMGVVMVVGVMMVGAMRFRRLVTRRCMRFVMNGGCSGRRNFRVLAYMGTMVAVASRDTTVKNFGIIPPSAKKS